VAFILTNPIEEDPATTRRPSARASASPSPMPPKSSRFRGVTLFRPTGKWRAQISVGGQTTSLGDHDTEEEAARAFDRAAIHFKGKAYAATNYELQEVSDQQPCIPDRSAARGTRADVQRSHRSLMCAFGGRDGVHSTPTSCRVCWP